MKKTFSIIWLLSLILSCQNNDFIATTKSFNYPVLKNKADNPVFRLDIFNSTNKNSTNNILLKIKNSNTTPLKAIRVFYSKSDSLFNNKTQFGKTISNIKQVETLLDNNIILQKGHNYFWISYELKEAIDLTSKVSASIEDVKINNKSIITKEDTPKALRLGVALKQHNDDGIDTYRIPGLATSNKGTLLAIYDERHDSKRDLQGNIDIGLSRSLDHGNTWLPMQTVLDMGTYGNLPEKFNGVSDACILVDKNTGTIFVAGLWMHGVINNEGKWVEGLTKESEDWNHQWKNKGSQPGLGIKETSQFLITKSTDDGKTWSDPMNITPMVKNPKWWLLAPAPGHGITLDDGTLVFPTEGRDETGETFSNITYSKDGGKTWYTSNPAAKNTTENMIVQLTNGSIMMNMRDNDNKNNFTENNGRNIAVTTNLGETWTQHHTSNHTLIEPQCMASIHKHDYVDNNGTRKHLLLFSNPNSKKARTNQTIKVSFDDGKTWPEKYWLELDEGKGAGYSCITSIDENTIGVVYEGSQSQLTFQVISLKDLLKENL